jgi:UDP:flavonoid glycosyltransferase YjiC (YdhE family)
VGVLVAEQAQQRGAQLADPVRERHDLQREAVRRLAHDERAVAVNGGLDVDLEGGEEGLPPAGAEADDPDLAVRRRRRAQPASGTGGIADEARVRRSSPGDDRRAPTLCPGGRGARRIPMRVMITTAPGAGHLFPLVPLAWALRSAGHDLLLATAGAGVELGPAAGLPTVDAAPGMDMHDVVRSLGTRAGGFAGKAVPDAREHAVTLFTEVSRRLLDGVRRAADLWQPDVVLHEGMDGAGAVVAAERGIPRVEHSISPAAGPGVMGTLIQRGLTEAAPVPAVASIGIGPPSMAPAPDPGWTIRTVPYNGGAVVPPSVLTAPERPRVLVTMGTVAPRMGGTGTIRALVEAVAAEPVEVLVALGLDPAELGPLPASVHAHRWVPLTAALPRCSAIVHHCGAGTTLSALAAGVPQVVVPQGADQFLNADALVRRGCAVRGSTEPDVLQAAVRRALSGELAATAEDVRREISTLPTPAVVAAELGALLGAR